jgi:hypothetical protein
MDWKKSKISRVVQGVLGWVPIIAIFRAQPRLGWVLTILLAIAVVEIEFWIDRKYGFNFWGWG